ncbi:MAG TPA: DegT/DnrJ/EryC1/StrS aminotransferase family protein [Victivallales bacterium]|nr:DegT/DnrJ/EryC1/StrS aminotransferase family protein [Victivallales bacterium]HRR06353.1 DegT/DnrJ/EryC1/StrS aminotransferase family protein [Victivallales bacterium]HRR29135.1 DegT/DnrJ/EryC1/StrS aminotransferase family protein [Victivallales bacterium]
MSEIRQISFHKASLGKDEIKEVVDCLKSGWLTTGARVRKFETDFASYIGAKFAIALNSCTAALHLALEAIGLKENEIVIVPSMTFAATAEVVRYFNAIPVFVDCNEDDFCMSVDSLKETVEKIIMGKKLKGVPDKHGDIRAIIPVHFGGAPANIPEIAKIAKTINAKLIEDCAHACPAFYKNAVGKFVKAGTEADIACYSFYANKTITTGEGGMAVCNNPEYDERIRIMSLHGISKDAWKRFTASGSWRYEIIAPGYKYNMPDIMAAIGIHQLKKADVFMEKRAKIAKLYNLMLSDLSDIITLPYEREGIISSWHLYPIRIREGKNKVNRDSFIEKLKKNGIITSVHYIPLHMHKYYKEKYFFSDGDFPVSEKLSRECVSLPIYPDLRKTDLDYIVKTIKRVLRG